MADEILQYDADNYRVAGAIDDVGGEIRNIRSDANGYIQCEATAIVNEYKVAVTTNDTTPNYLSSKIVDTASVVWTVNNPGANETYSAAVVPGASSFYQTIQEDGVALTQRAIFNFKTYFTVTDNVTKTDITLDIAAIEPALDLANIGGLLDLSTQVTGLLAATNIDITNLESTLDLANIAGSLDLTTQVTGILPVANGGTGASTLTGVLHGNGTSAVTAVPLTTDGAILIGDGSGAPTTLAAFSSATGTLKVANGGTGRASHTAYAVLCGGTTTTAAQQSVASVGTAGQVLTSNGAGTLPTFQAVTVSGISEQLLGGNDAPTSNGATNYVQSVTSTTDGSVLFISDSESVGGDSYVTRYEKDAGTGMYYKTHRVQITGAVANLGLCVVGTYLYVFSYNLFNFDCDRVLASDLSGQTSMTVPAIASVGGMAAFTDGTYLYCNIVSNTQWTQFTISGTTLTNTGTITGGKSNTVGAYYDGTYAFMVDNVNNVESFTYTVGGAFVSVNSKTFDQSGIFTGNQTFAVGISAIDSSKIYLTYRTELTLRIGSTTSSNTKSLALLKPFTKPI